MRVTRIYGAQLLMSGQQLSLDSRSSHHLLRVLRLQLGATVQIFDGNGNEFAAQLSGTHKQQALLMIHQRVATIPESPLIIHLGQSISRGEKMDYTIQKAVELGVNMITPLFSDYGGVALSGIRLVKRVEHWQRIIISACEQSGRSHLPVLASPCSLEQWLLSCQEVYRLVLDPNGDYCLKDLECFSVLNTASVPLSVALMIGSEGGFSSAEIDCAKQQGFHALQFGPRILRTETAALAIIAALQSRWGDMRTSAPTLPNSP